MKKTWKGFILALSLILMFFSPLKGAAHAFNREGGQFTSVSGVIPEAAYRNYKILLKEKYLPLLGKLMTVFLADRDKAYKIESLPGEGVFAIESRRTIQPGSRIYIKAIDEGRFHFTGELLLRKIVKFTCFVEVEISYKSNGTEVGYQADLFYSAPVVIEGVSNFITEITGWDFVGKKIMEVIENMHFVLDQAACLDAEGWQEILNDRERLENLFFPVSFTAEEQELIQDLIQKEKGD